MTMIFEPEPTHWCSEELSTFYRAGRTPVPGSVAQCTCGRFYVLDERSGTWRRVGKRSRLVRDALAHQEERRSR